MAFTGRYMLASIHDGKSGNTVLTSSVDNFDHLIQNQECGLKEISETPTLITLAFIPAD